MKTKECKGQCINCGSENLNYETIEQIEDEQAYYKFVCEDCGTVGKEYYKLVYMDTEDIS